MKFQPSNSTDSVTDPNPNDAAEYELTLLASADTMSTVTNNPVPFSERMHDLYGGKCPTAIVDLCLNQLRKLGTTTVYVGTFKQCVAFVGSFREMGFEARYNEIKF